MIFFGCRNLISCNRFFHVLEVKAMSQIKITNLTFGYDGSFDNVFENVSFTIDTDWRLGFTGRNGRGKTTFLNLLQGKYEYSGSITHTVDFSAFPFEVGDASQYTIDVVNSAFPECEHWRIAKELSLLETDESVLYRPFETLSNGERTKVLLAVLFLRENNFLLIDEPTNHLDEASRAVVADYLKCKKGFILVSHDRNVLDACTDHTLSINKTDIEIEQGNFSSWFKNKEMRDSFELAENDRLKKEISHLQKAAAEKARWADKSESYKIGSAPPKIAENKNRRVYQGAKSKKLMARAKSYEDRAEKAAADKARLLKNIETAENLKLSTLNYHSENLAYLKNVSVIYSETPVCADISFEIKKGDRIALKGKNGCGKSSVIKLLCGENIPYGGEFKVGSGLVISYVSQDTSFLRGDLRGFAAESGIDESLFKAILRKLDFSREQFEKDMCFFSEGQKKKVIIAESLCKRAHLYVWDEPLNYIDIFSRMQLEKLILDFCPTMLFVEHDKAFCDKIATKTILMQKTKNAGAD